MYFRNVLRSAFFFVRVSGQNYMLKNAILPLCPHCDQSRTTERTRAILQVWSLSFFFVSDVEWFY